MIISPKEQLIRELEHLTPEQHEYLLEVAHKLQKSRLPLGTSGDAMLAMIDKFNFDPDDLAMMMDAIEEGCERIDWDEWQ